MNKPPFKVPLASFMGDMGEPKNDGTDHDIYSLRMWVSGGKWWLTAWYRC